MLISIFFTKLYNPINFFWFSAGFNVHAAISSANKIGTSRQARVHQFNQLKVGHRTHIELSRPLLPSAEIILDKVHCFLGASQYQNKQYLHLFVINLNKN